jgi:hypothetical protein
LAPAAIRHLLLHVLGAAHITQYLLFRMPPGAHFFVRFLALSGTTIAIAAFS